MFSPNGKTVLTGGEDGTARLWDAATGAPRGEVMRHEGPVLSMEFSLDGKTIATGSYDGMARLWDAATCRQRGPNLPHHGSVHAVSIRYDGKFLATGSSVVDRDINTGKRTPIAGEVRIWHTPSGELYGQPMRHYLPVWAVSFRPRGGKLLVGGVDRAARFYSILDGAIVGKPLDHEGTVPNVVFSPKGRLALTASAGGPPSHARLWELAPGDPVTWAKAIFYEGGQRVEKIAIAPDGLSVLGCLGNQVREYDIITGEPVRPVLVQRDPVHKVYYSPDGRTLVIVSTRFDIGFWDRASGRRIREISPGAKFDPLLFSWDGKSVAALHEDRSLSVYRVPSGEHQGTVKLAPQHTEVVLGTDGRFAYTHDSQGQVQEWGISAGKLHHVFKAPGPVRMIRFVEGKAIVITGEARHLARAWDLETGEPRSGPLTDLVGDIRALAMSPHGHTILTGLWDGRNARLWDMATGKPIGPPVQHSESVDLVAFTPDGKRMMSFSTNGEFRAQDVPSLLPGDAERIRCWVEILTGMELDAEGTIHDLSAEALQERRERLRALGGPPDGSQLE
jgi:WD40 repeat protein